MDSPCFSSARARVRVVTVALALAAAALAPGCVTVRPEQREFLADPAMTFGAGGMVEQNEDHVLSNREGSAGAGSVTGGGCGCN